MPRTITPVDPSKPALIRGFLEDYYDAWKGTDVRRILSYYAPEIVLETPVGRMEGRSAVEERFVRPFVSAFPGNVHTIRLVAHAPRLAAVEWSVRAVHRGPFAGIAVSHNPIQLTGASFYEYSLEHRQITAGRIYFDLGELMRQAGAS